METIWTRRVKPMIAARRKPYITNTSHRLRMFMKGCIINRGTFDWWKAQVLDPTPLDAAALKRSMQALWGKCR